MRLYSLWGPAGREARGYRDVREVRAGPEVREARADSVAAEAADKEVRSGTCSYFSTNSSTGSKGHNGCPHLYLHNNDGKDCKYYHPLMSVYVQGVQCVLVFAAQLTGR